MHDERRLFQELPPALRGEIAVHRHGNSIEALPFCSDLDYATLAHLCTRIHYVAYVQMLQAASVCACRLCCSLPSPNRGTV